MDQEGWLDSIAVSLFTNRETECYRGVVDWINTSSHEDISISLLQLAKFSLIIHNSIKIFIWNFQIDIWIILLLGGTEPAQRMNI